MKNFYFTWTWLWGWEFGFIFTLLDIDFNYCRMDASVVLDVTFCNMGFSIGWMKHWPEKTINDLFSCDCEPDGG